MKTLFVVGAKLVGLLVLYWAMPDLPQLFAYIPYLLLVSGEAGRMGQFGPSWPMCAGIVGHFILMLCLAWALLFRTERVAGILGVPDNELTPSSFSESSILRLGITLIGVYALVRGIPLFAKCALAIYGEWRPKAEDFQTWEFVSAIFQILLGAALTFRPDRVAAIITRKTTAMSTLMNSIDENSSKEQ